MAAAQDSIRASREWTRAEPTEARAGAAL